MKPWKKILIYFPMFFVFSGVLYGILFLIFPESYSATRDEYEILMTTNYAFMLSSQLALLLGTFGAIYFVYNIDKQKPWYLKSMFQANGIVSGVIIGFIEISLIILFLSFSGKLKINFQGFGIEIIWYLILFILVAISEEAMARGFIFANLYAESNRYLAIIISSLIFSVLHAFNSSFSFIGMINLLLVGVFFCQLYLKNMNLSIPVGYHLSWNFFQGPVFGFSVSGFTTHSIFKIENVSGFKFPFEGFGLEGSLYGTIVLILFILYFYFSHTRHVLKKEEQVVEII